MLLAGRRGRVIRWSPIAWPIALALAAADLTHTQVHAMLLMAAGLALLGPSMSVRPLGSGHWAGWTLVAVGQVAETIGAGLDAHRGSLGESIHSAGQLLGLLSVIALLAAVVRPSPATLRGSGRVGARLVPLAAAASILGLQSGAPLALLLVPATGWAALAASGPAEPRGKSWGIRCLRPGGKRDG